MNMITTFAGLTVSEIKQLQADNATFITESAKLKKAADDDKAEIQRLKKLTDELVNSLVFQRDKLAAEMELISKAKGINAHGDTKYIALQSRLQSVLTAIEKAEAKHD